jgi:hypothetical protein
MALRRSGRLTGSLIRRSHKTAIQGVARQADEKNDGRKTVPISV